MPARIQGAGPTGSEGHPIAFVSVAPGANMSNLNAARVQGAGPLGTEGDPIGAVILGTGGVAFTPNSVIFAGTGGALAEDNTHLNWDRTNGKLLVAGIDPDTTQFEVRFAPSQDVNDAMFRLATDAGAALVEVNKFGKMSWYRNTTGVGAQDAVKIGHFDWVWNPQDHATRQGRCDWRVTDSSGTERLAVRIDANGSAAEIGFLGVAASPRQSVTGSRGGNAALASLLTALATFGLITDNTTA